MMRKTVLSCVVCSAFVAAIFSACGDDSQNIGTTGTIEGTATLAGASDHRGILITLVESGDSATTGADGRYRLGAVAPGTYTLAASKPGYVPAGASAAVVVTAGQVTQVGALELVVVQGSVSGVARREGASDHAGITVRLTGGPGGGTPPETQTDASGAFAFEGVASGTYLVTAEAQGFATATSSPVLVDAVGTPVDVGTLVLALGRGGLEGIATLAGAGADEHGGILVTLQNTGYATLTGPSGRYAFSGIPAGQYAVVASRSGYADGSVSDQTVEAGQVTSVPTLALASDPGTITGVATLEGATGFAGILVSIPGTSHTATTAADGSFTLSGVTAGTYVVEATQTGYETATSAPFTLAAGASVNVGTLALRVARGSLTGTATLQGETSHGSILVVLSGTAYATMTGPTGSWVLSGVPAGTYTVVASRDGWADASSGAMTVVGNQTTTLPLLVLASNPGTITGVATLEGATSFAGILVSIPGTSHTATTAVDGSFTLSGVAAGTYVVEATQAGYDAATSAPFTLAAGGAVNVGTLALHVSRGSLTGTATLEGETSHGGILVVLSGTAYATMTGPTGAWVLTGVPAGTYTVVASRDGWADASSGAMTVVGNQTTTVPPLVLASNPGTITGVATLEGTTGFAGIVVSIPGTSHTAVTAVDGSFTLSGVAAGTYVVEATQAGYDSATSAPFTLAAGGAVNVGTLALRVARGSLTGTVELAGESAHGGVLVEVVGTPHSAISNSAGEWALAGVPVGTFEVRASKTGWATASAPSVTVVGNATTTVGHLVLPGNPGSITGVVQKEGETDHAGILVTVNGTAHSGATLADGSFTITGVPGGVYSMSAEAQGFTRYDYPVVVVTGGQATAVGQVVLARKQGKVQGLVQLEGMPYHTGALIELLGSSYTTTSAADGTWELWVPVGNYVGVRASAPHYVTQEHNATVTVTDSGVANIPPFLMSATDNDVSGRVTLYQQTDHSGVLVELMGMLGEPTEGLYFQATSDAAGDFVLSGVPLGAYSIRYSNGTGWGTISRFVQVLAGPALVLPPEQLRNLYVYINADAAWTNLALVTLTLGASDCLHMRVGNQADLSGVTWETCTATKPWTLLGPDGTNVVYAQFRNSQLDETEVVSDSIWLDRVSAIASLTEDTGGAPKSRNQVIHFTLDANGELGGVATVDIAGYQAGIALYDDGTHGDTAADDGVYELDYVVSLPTDVNNATVTGHFTDAYANVAPSATAPGTVTIAIPPAIFNVRIVPDSTAGTATISWDTDEPASGRLDWGPNAFYGNTETDGAFTTSHGFTIGGGALQQSTPYHVRITATDQAGNPAYTPDRIFYLKPNPPEMVIAMPGDGRFDVRWEAPPQANVVGYNVYRASAAGGPYSKLNASGVYTHEALAYHDLTVTNGQTYYYVVTAVDEYANESDYSSEVSGVPDTNSGPTQVNGVLPAMTVWTSKHSPVVVTGSVLVPAGGVLAIGPGTTVKFQPGTYLRADGQIVLIGDSGAGVVLTSNQAVPAIGDWDGLRLHSPVSGRYDWSTGRYFAGCLMHEVTVEYSRESGIYVQSSGCAVQRSTIRRNDRTTAYLDQGRFGGGGVMVIDGELLVTDSFITDNELTRTWDQGGGSGLLAMRSVVHIFRTRVSGNYTFVSCGEGCGAVLFNRSRGLVVDSAIDGNHTKGSQMFAGGVGVQGELGGVPTVIVSSSISDNIAEVMTGGNDEFMYRSGGIGGFNHMELPGAPPSLVLIGVEIRGNDILGPCDERCAQSVEFSGAAPGPGQEMYGCLIEGPATSTCPTCSGVHGRWGTYRWNWIRAGALGTNVISVTPLGTGALDISFQSNSLELGGASYLLSSTALRNLGSITAMGNFWGTSTTAQMDSLGNGANISAIWDYYDDFGLAEVQYGSWAHSAFPMARIDTPRWGTRHIQGDTISFTGHADDPEDGALTGSALSWSSDLDGPLGTGAALDVSTLSVGHHQIWLTATDSMGQEGKIWVEIDVVE